MMMRRFLVVCTASILMLGACSSDVADETEETPVGDADVENDAVDEPADEPVEETPEPDVVEEPELPLGDAGNPAPFGETLTVGDWDVTVVSADFDATETVLSFNEFNSEPDGKFTLVELDATYTGDDVGVAGLELFVRYVTDGAVFNDFDCSAITPGSLVEVDDAGPGESVTGTLCLEVPEGVTENGIFSVEDGTDVENDPVFWSDVN